MTIQQLKYLVALSEEKHFSKAAEKCLVSQPALTIQIKNLEEEIGVQLIERGKTPFTFTEAGIEIIQKAQKILNEVEGIRKHIVSKKNDLKGEICIGVVSTIYPYLIPKLIASMALTTPDLHIRIKELSSLKLIQELENGQIDIALMATPTGSSHVNEFPIFEEPFVAYLPEIQDSEKGLPFQIENEFAFPLLLLKSEYCFNAQLLEICADDIEVESTRKVNYEITSVETLKNMVKAKLGFAIVPFLSALNVEDKSHVIPFGKLQPAREISLVTSASFHRKKVLELIQKAIWENLPSVLKERTEFTKINWNDSPYFKAFIDNHKH